MKATIIGLGFILLACLEVRADVPEVAPLAAPADKDQRKPPPPPQEDALTSGCSPTFCATCPWNCNNQICAQVCAYCYSHGLCP